MCCCLSVVMIIEVKSEKASKKGGRKRYSSAMIEFKVCSGTSYVLTLQRMGNQSKYLKNLSIEPEELKTMLSALSARVQNEGQSLPTLPKHLFQSKFYKHLLELKQMQNQEELFIDVLDCAGYFRAFFGKENINLIKSFFLIYINTNEFDMIHLPSILEALLGPSSNSAWSATTTTLSLSPTASYLPSSSCSSGAVVTPSVSSSSLSTIPLPASSSTVVSPVAIALSSPTARHSPGSYRSSVAVVTPSVSSSLSSSTGYYLAASSPNVFSPAVCRGMWGWRGKCRGSPAPTVSACVCVYVCVRA